MMYSLLTRGILSEPVVHQVLELPLDIDVNIPSINISVDTSPVNVNLQRNEVNLNIQVSPSEE